MGFFSKLGSAVIQTALLPVEVAKDVCTLGGVCMDEETPYTVKRLKKLGRAVEDAIDDLDD